MLNFDQKLLSKILANIPRKILPGRYIGESIRFIDDILSFCDNKKRHGILFAADFESAFDSLEHNFIFEMLSKLGFSASFINWIKLLHTNLESSIMNNGYSTGYFNLGSGNRQGDPMAPYILY